MAVGLALAVASFALSGIKWAFDWDKGNKDLAAAADNFELSKESFQLQKDEFKNNLLMGKIDLSNALNSAKSTRLDIMGKKDSLGITKTDYESKVASYQEFLDRFPAFQQLEKDKLANTQRGEFRKLRNEFGETNVRAAGRGQSGGSAALISAEAMEDLAIYAGDDLSLDDLATGRVGLAQRTKEEQALDLLAQEREAKTQKGIYETSITTLTTSQGSYQTALDDADTYIKDIQDAIDNWDTQVEAYLAGLTKKEKPKDPGPLPKDQDQVVTTTEQTATVETVATAEPQITPEQIASTTGNLTDLGKDALIQTDPKDVDMSTALLPGGKKSVFTTSAFSVKLDGQSYTTGAGYSQENDGYSTGDEANAAYETTGSGLPYIPTSLNPDNTVASQSDPLAFTPPDPNEPVQWDTYGLEE